VRVFCSLVVRVFLVAALLGSAVAQSPLSPGDAKNILPLFDAPSPNSLKCWLERWSPTLDFAFRFVTGYVTYCRLSQFEGKNTALVTYARVTPQGKTPKLFGMTQRVPAITAEVMQSIGGDLEKLRNDIGISGGFALGEGTYRIELLLKDNQNRTYRRKWQLRVAARRSERGVALAMAPLTVQSIEQVSWQTAFSERQSNLRLTIFLDASPVNPHQSSLRAWDRAFLLEIVSSVLRQTPHKIVHLVAFSLEQQRELFRSDDFDSAAFRDLSRVLKEVELSNISVKALKGRESPQFLVALADQELASGRCDAIIFLGANARMDTEVSEGALTRETPTSPPMFYFEYFPWVGSDFPDSIDWLVKSTGGKVFVIHSPAQFDDSIDKMLLRLKQE
jgi:hypothetical protein